MSEKRIILFGADGQIGQAIQAEPLPAEYRLHAYSHADLDITQLHLVQSTIREVKPDLIINSAAITNVDAAEQNTAQALAVNFDAVANIAAQASAMDVSVIHLSTDYVFDGEDGETPYAPDAPMNPVNVYGESKMMGEEALRHELAWHVILRVSSVFSAYGKNLLTAMLAAIDSNDEIKAFTDRTSGLTAAPEIAKAIMKMANDVMNRRHGIFGTYHLCGAPPATRYEFTSAVMEAYAPYTSRRPKIIPVSGEVFSAAAKRPHYSVLDCSRIREVFGIEQKPWRDGLAEAMSKLMGERKKIA